MHPIDVIDHISYIKLRYKNYMSWLYKTCQLDPLSTNILNGRRMCSFRTNGERERQRTYSNLGGAQVKIAVATCHGGSRQPIGPSWAQFACWCHLIIKFLDSWWISSPITIRLSIATEGEIVWSDHYGIQRGISLSCCMCHAIIVICLN